jgi:hypothetical protein
MEKQDVIFFRPYPFSVGDRIRIESGPRSGDWEVIDVSEKKVKLRCPVSGVEVEWNRFCYYTEKKPAVWPETD